MEQEKPANVIHYSIIVATLIILFISTWFVLNDSYQISRDELWYTHYSVEWDASRTDDTRYLRDKDIHQVAFTPLFRAAQGLTVATFGKNIYGLRILNLLMATAVMIIIAILFYRHDIPALWLGLLMMAYYSDQYLTDHLFHMRPDWLMEMCFVIMVSTVFLYFKTEKIQWLIASAIIAGLACGIYWNGIAAVAGYVIVIILMLIKKHVSLKVGFITLSILSLSIFIFFLLPMIYYWEETRSLFSDNTPIITAQEKSDNFFIAYFQSMTAVLSPILQLSRYALVLMFLFGSLLFLAVYDSVKNRIFKLNTSMLAIVWFIVFLAIVSYRSGGPRFLFFLLPVLYLAVIFGIATFLKNIDKRNWRYSIITLAILFFLGNLGLNARHWINSRGQWSTYQQYKNDLNHIITDKESGVFTTYTLSWAIDENPKLFNEAYKFSNINTYEEFDTTLTNANIKYIIVHERTIIRMQSKDEFGINFSWYLLLKQKLDNNGKLIGVVYNKRYTHNKGIPPKDPRGFKTEIWVINNKYKQTQ